MLRHLVALLVALVPVAFDAEAPVEWRLVELWRSGGDTTLQVAWDDVVDMERAANGQLLVLVGGATRQLFVVDNRGRPVAVAGGRDGRFDNPNGVVQLGDGRIVVNEPRAGRLTVLSDRGTFIDQRSYEPWGYAARWMGFVHVDGGLYEPIVSDAQLVWRRWSPSLDTVELQPAGACDFGMMRAAPDATYELHSRDRNVVLPVPFLQPPVSIVRSRDGSTWTGLGPDFRELVRTPWRSCDDDARIMLEGEPIAVSSDERAAAMQRVRQAALSIGAPDPDLGRIPDVYPLFNSLHLDRQNRLWVDRVTGPSSRTFSVHAPDGRLLAEAAMPLPVDIGRPVVFGDNEVTFFTTDEHGWVWLVTMRIQGPSGASGP